MLLAASVEMAEAAAWYDERVSGLGAPPSSLDGL
jgi:hypothetical protein